MMRRFIYLLPLLLLPLLLATAFTLNNASAAPVIHRAIEPAQILLDITLTKNNLTLFLRVPEQSLGLLAPDEPQQSIAQRLTDTPNLWHTSPKAECSLSSHRIFQNQSDDSNESSGDVEGFYDFHCQTPQALKSVQSDLQTALPGLKQMNIWLTTDFWQNKQTLTLPENRITIHPDTQSARRGP
ncbi:hypothetical protein GZ77_07380 [Endozoicomonas montiporae]|uniref:DUF2796 domain-containing protein n=2 Tax=Endozoicomonas montiporae TaxID=1027273 RepID=A0A081N712_9GAMM|nr:DUF2796 domain-containing protein [Endozoicomonas montiporae]AMO55953.1 hypothetical protein EZMO1_1810 [Endozoicomonas montiporae CL-33]KEQ14235.1 hypothetical protein GZ77_07380 [Endozoicomonas montiporae]